MSRQQFRATVHVPVPVETLFSWHEAPGAFERLSPPWARRRDNKRFGDVLPRGLFAMCEHTHEFEADGPQASRLTDIVDYALPMGRVGALLGARHARETIRRVFAYRHQLMLGDLERHAAYRDRAPLRIAVTGATGMIGSQLVAFLTTGGHTVIRIGRGTVQAGHVDVSWDPARGLLDARALDGVDAVVHLAGAPIAERWNTRRRRAIRESRIQSTTLLARTIAQLDRKPRVMISGSAVGYYGTRGAEVLDEESSAGSGFLADVVKEWEDRTAAASGAGIRVVHVRTGIVQCAAGGALAKQLPLFRAGMGGRLGRKGLWISPIALDDEIGAMHHCLMCDDITGAVNFGAPAPITNDEYAHTLGRVLHRPALFPVPELALEVALGTEMARQTVLSSQRMLPRALERSGFRFRHPTLDAMLRFELGFNRP